MDQTKGGFGQLCGALGRALASNIRDSPFESCHQQFCVTSFTLKKLHWKDENKENRVRESPNF